MAIPKIIHYCWFGNNPKPVSVLKCIESWKKCCPDYEIKEWSEKNINFDEMCDYCRQSYEKKAWGFVPDYIRLWIIYKYGGVYLDTDVELIKRLDDNIMNNKAFAGIEVSDKNSDGSCVALGLGFGAEPGNPFIYRHMKLYEDINFINEDGSLNRKPSPLYTTELLLKDGFNDKENVVQKLEDIIIYPTEYFCPKDYISGAINITPNTYSIHHYDASWFDEKEQKMKKKRWKNAKVGNAVKKVVKPFVGEEKAESIKDKIQEGHLLNRVVMKVVGMKRYEKLKSKLKR